jgi:hypothetical protein
MLHDLTRTGRRSCSAVAALSALALSPSSLQPALGQQGIQIRGTVVRALDGKPVEGATVTLIGRGAPAHGTVEQTATGALGDFELRTPSIGEYTLSASLFRMRLASTAATCSRDPLNAGFG